MFLGASVSSARSSNAGDLTIHRRAKWKRVEYSSTFLQRSLVLRHRKIYKHGSRLRGKAALMLHDTETIDVSIGTFLQRLIAPRIRAQLDLTM